jgi:hypothetical protein
MIGTAVVCLGSIAPKLAKLFPLLGSDKDGEVLGTVEALKRTLRSAGHDFHDLAKVLTAPSRHAASVSPTNWSELIAICLSHPEALNARDLGFLRDMRRQILLGRKPSEKQADWLRSCWARVDAAGAAQ